jgi:hypothetical protein
MGTYAKAITAFLTGLVGFVALFIPAVGQFVSPEMIAAITVVINTLLVYLVPNKIGATQVEASRSTYGT